MSSPVVSAEGSGIYTSASLPTAVQALQLHFPDLESITYKQLKESFVSGHTGVEFFLELSLLLLSVGLWVCLHRLLCIYLRDRRRSRPAHSAASSFVPLSRARDAATISGSRRSFISSVLPSFAFDFVLLVAPVAWSMTLGADYVHTLVTVQVAMIASVACVHRLRFGYWCLRLPPFGSRGRTNNKKRDEDAVDRISDTDQLVLRRLNQAPKLFITNYRTSLMIGTSVAILAVDFVSFPRRYCKTESFGLGMMDGGVGSFIISHALTSVHARGGGSSAHRRSLLGQLWHILRSVLPLVVLGAARLFTVRAVDYQEHVSEYGVHWNFFFTLGAVALLSGALSRAIRARTAFVFGAALLVAYQVALSFGGLTEYLLTAPRVSLFSANKEGLLSSIGYFSLYLMAVRAGSEVIGEESSIDKWTSKIVKMAVFDVFLWIATLLSSSYVQASSRRMVNLSYGLWMASLNLMLLLQFLLLEACTVDAPSTATHKTTRRDVSCDDDQGATGAMNPSESWCARPPSSIIVEAINRNSLPFFLICNLCTGAVNLSMQTIFASNAVAMAVLLSYLGVTCLAIVFADYRGWVIKL